MAPSEPLETTASGRGRRPPAILGVAGVVVVTVALTGAFGGLRARPQGPARISPGRTVDQGLFHVQVLDARIGRFKLLSFEKPGNKLAVRMRVSNVGDESRGVSTFLGSIAAEPKPGHYVAADGMQSDGIIMGGKTSDIDPGLPVVVQAVWPLPDTTTLRSITIVLRAWHYGQGFTEDDFYWSVTPSSPVTATVTLPVRQGATS